MHEFILKVHRHAYVRLRKNLLDRKMIPKANELFSENCLLCNERGNHTLLAIGQQNQQMFQQNDKCLGLWNV